MSYVPAAMYCQPLVTGGGGGGDCDPYTKPSPTAITTNLDTVPVLQSPTSVETNLCAPVS